jgi:hypothetical protein
MGYQCIYNANRLREDIMQRRCSYLLYQLCKKMERNSHERTSRWKMYGKPLFFEDLEVQDGVFSKKGAKNVHTLIPHESTENRHLLVLDGHGSHVTLRVVCKAAKTRLDVISLQSHTSHALQPLDVAIFSPFKCAFCRYRDVWIAKNRRSKTQKEDLAQWMHLALQRALTT